MKLSLLQVIYTQAIWPRRKVPFSAYLVCHVAYRYPIQINSLLNNISPSKHLRAIIVRSETMDKGPFQNMLRS